MIPSHAAYLLTDSSPASASLRRVTNSDGNEITWNGIGVAKAQQIYYRVLANDMLTSTARFTDMRSALRKACLQLVDAGPAASHGVVLRDCGVIMNAFAAVGIGEPDSDFDSIPDERSDGVDSDNCRSSVNRDQADEDRDGQGNACEEWMLLTIEQKWRTATDLCNRDSPPSSALQNHRTTYYFGTRDVLQHYAEGARTDVRVGEWVNTSGTSWEHFEISTPTLTEVADEAAGQAQFDALKSANPTGSDTGDDAAQTWQVWSQFDQPVPISADEIKAACGEDDSLGGDTDDALTWVLVETLVNPANAPLETGAPNERFAGSFQRWTVSETSMTSHSHSVDRGVVQVDVIGEVSFDAPPASVAPGETFSLSASGTLSGEIWCASVLEQFHYSNERGFTFEGSFFSMTYGNCTCDVENKTCEIAITEGSSTTSVTAPPGVAGSEWIIQAGLWNCSACTVRWVYELQ